MPVYAQHGHGKGERLRLGLEGGWIEGVILSPRDEGPDAIAQTIDSIREANTGAVVLFDPLFCASLINPVRDGRLPDYDFYKPALSRRDFIGVGKVERIVERALAFQGDLDVTAFLSPTILLNGLSDSWSQIA